MAEVHLRLGEVPLARARLERGLEANPENQDLWRRLVRLQEAEQLLARARKSESGSNWSEAELVYRQMIETEPRLLQGHLGLARACVKQKKHAQAIKVLEDWLAVDRGCAQAHSDLAWIRLTAEDERVRDATDGLRHARQAVELAPKRAEYAQTLARALFLAGQYDEANEVLERARQQLEDEAQEP